MEFQPGIFESNEAAGFLQGENSKPFFSGKADDLKGGGFDLE